ncbi:MAG: hypothetical protein P4M11_06955 [Candidatus Pacebacteria bacterium]|nr:hypothetical protein [Candidatus Paceibacterota bacterium]
MALSEFIHEDVAMQRIEEELQRREQAAASKEQQAKQTDEKPQANMEPSTWDSVKDTDLFVFPHSLREG